MRTSLPLRTALLLTGLLGSASSQALTFNFTDVGATAMSAQALQGFNDAAAQWSSRLSDNVTVNMDIAFDNTLAAGVLGSTASTQANYNYGTTRTALIGDVSSASDASSSTSLKAGSVDMLINYTNDLNAASPTAQATPVLDNNASANNTTIHMSNANAKALGLLAANAAAVDASIKFNSAFTWDFSTSGPIASSAFSFVSVAAHEIGHALGFISGVDILDGNATTAQNAGAPFPSNAYTFVSTLDLFRYSASSVANGIGTIDWSAGASSKYFSVDGGTTNLATYATGVNFGDGQQASHWKDNLAIGLLDPTLAPGQFTSPSTLDLQALDVIGWNLTAAVPVPASVWLLGSGLLGLLGWSRRRSH